MYFVPSVVTKQSGSLLNARKRALDLYRLWLKSSVYITEAYQLDIPSSQIRSRVRQEFEKNRNVSDLGVVDILLLKGRQEYEETMNMWKQKTHIMRYYNEDTYAPEKPKDFLGKFYAGLD
ncbi:hypothetical protein HDU76_014022 [Blyttiomyces sp. JEL0837]|nr:hypothetical protein HDU76_014022 [Blyttiomyces sp. JEL0837]